MESLRLFFLFLYLFVSVHCSACELNSTKPHRHKWFEPTSQHTIVVDANGSGDFLSVQEAVDSVPENNTKRVIIHIHAGCYIEKVVVPATKPYVTFQGTGRNVTVIEWHDRANDRGPNGQQLRTYNTASVTVFANHFTARNISFKNTAPAPMPGMEGWQAAAFRISGDKANSPCERTGFAFVNCRVTGSGKLYVGRAMGQYSRIVFAYTYFDDVVAPGGWDDWNHNSNKNKTAFFGVYRCYGPGAAAVRGVSWARELDFETARPFLVKSFVNGRHWLGPSDP
ncbi:hypothetical protein C4D60_Mb04t21000 [Musa balbisiana]|uniref:pectinesterase n=1 Tax=Musa balbisiana TaxID=52838 RepID=A0A4S8KDQ8_MUSBA|nr:hypothetical protein C4D60_Mb04t21000 [Musa balbisiana]